MSLWATALLFVASGSPGCALDVSPEGGQRGSSTNEVPEYAHDENTRHVVALFDGTVAGNSFVTSSSAYRQLTQGTGDSFVTASWLLWQKVTTLTTIKPLLLAANGSEVSTTHFHGPDLRMKLFREEARINGGYHAVCQQVRRNSEQGYRSVVHLFGYSRGAVVAIAVSKRLGADSCYIQDHQLFDPHDGLLLLIEPVQYLHRPDDSPPKVASWKANFLALSLLNLPLHFLEDWVRKFPYLVSPSVFGAWHMGEHEALEVGMPKKEAIVDKELVVQLQGNAADDFAFAPLSVTNFRGKMIRRTLEGYNHLQAGGGFDMKSLTSPACLKDFFLSMGDGSDDMQELAVSVAAAIGKKILQVGSTTMDGSREHVVCQVLPELLQRVGLDLDLSSYCSP